MQKTWKLFSFVWLAMTLTSFSTVWATAEESQESTRPNILWITIEDWSTDLSCYGTAGIETPNVDKLAEQGMLFTNAFSTSPVCSTSRSAMMTGFHQNYIGANQHREYDKQALPHGIKPIPHLFAEAGYYTALMSSKVDCNFLPDKRHQLFMGKDWSERKPGQPFFARITLTGTHRPWKRDPNRPIKIDDVEIPPYYPDTPFCRRDWANGLEQMQLVDRQVGKLLKRLDDEGLTDNTIVFFVSDHGRCHIRGKQFLYDGGIHIPMIVRWPGTVSPGQVNDHMVMSIDICATILDAAGIKPPVPLHGMNLFGPKNRKFVFAARGRMGDTHDAMRTVRSKTHKLILNLMPERPWCQYSGYKEGEYPMLAAMNVMNFRSELTSVQAAFLATQKPKIELFDLVNDPFETKNLAGKPSLANVEAELLAALTDWRKNVINDQGVSRDFRAESIFPQSRPNMSVSKWVADNGDKYDFKKYGLPGWFPTRSQSEWTKVYQSWKPYVFRDPTESVARPKINAKASKARR